MSRHDAPVMGPYAWFNLFAYALPLAGIVATTSFLVSWQRSRKTGAGGRTAYKVGLIGLVSLGALFILTIVLI